MMEILRRAEERNSSSKNIRSKLDNRRNCKITKFANGIESGPTQVYFSKLSKYSNFPFIYPAFITNDFVFQRYSYIFMPGNSKITPKYNSDISLILIHKIGFLFQNHPT